LRRRTFLGLAADAVQAALAAAVVIPGVRFLLAPLQRRRGEAAFQRLAPLQNVSAGEPVRVVVTADRWDAYVHHPPGPIGNVWLIRGDDDAAHPRIRCLQTICPHLGCGIDYQPARGVFSCPCHASEFDSTGKATSGPSPRPMDELECRISEPDEQGRRWVEVYYQEFEPGVVERRPVV
jgi:Rieske Fe-S protein